MSALERVKLIGGWVLHVAIGGMMILAGSGKVLGFVPPEEMAKYGLGEYLGLKDAGGKPYTRNVFNQPTTCPPPGGH